VRFISLLTKADNLNWNLELKIKNNNGSSRGAKGDVAILCNHRTVYQPELGSIAAGDCQAAYGGSQ
jgi:hypothetical protein